MKTLGRLAVFSLAFCGSFALTTHAVAQDRIPRIINGDPTDEFESVGIVGSLARGQFCTGTLISPFHVITAAHCVEIIASSDTATFEIDGQTYETSNIEVHPNYNSRNLTNDLAILELAEPVSGIAPTELFRSQLVVGDLLTIVGYGASGDAQGSDGSFGTKLVGTTPIDDLTSTEVIWYFDDSSEGNSAAGDSGGPAFIDIDDVYYLAAIVSSGTEPDAALGDIAFNMRVEAYVDWIDAVVGTFDPGEEPNPDDDVDVDDEPVDEGPDEPEDPGPPTDEAPSDPDETVELPDGCRHEFGSAFNWRPHGLKPSRGQMFRRPSRRPPTHVSTNNRVTRHPSRNATVRHNPATSARRGLSSRSPRRSR